MLNHLKLGLLVALGLAFVGLAAVAPELLGGPDREHQLAIPLIAMAGLGLSIRWSAYLGDRLSRPPKLLGLGSKIAGWLAVGLFPMAVVLGDPRFVAGTVLLPLSTLGLWARQPWALLPWYAVATLFPLVALYQAVRAWSAKLSGTIDTTSGALGAIEASIVALIWSGIGLQLLEDLARWRRPIADRNPFDADLPGGDFPAAHDRAT